MRIIICDKKQVKVTDFRPLPLFGQIRLFFGFLPIQQNHKGQIYDSRYCQIYYSQYRSPDASSSG
jgi:hypothetical protein